MKRTRLFVVYVVLAPLTALPALSCGSGSGQPTTNADAGAGPDAAAPLPHFADLKPGVINVIRPGGATICSRGGEYAFFVIPGARDKVIIEFEGGGACWNDRTCALSSSLFKEKVDVPALMQSLAGLEGWYDHNHPGHPMKEWTHVFLPYCTGDIHWGDSVQTYGTGDMKTTINHRGAVNATAALGWTYAELPKPAKVFVTGCSAGGYGSIFWAPQVQKHYGSGSKVYHFSDSAAGVITADFFEKSFPVWNVEAHYPSFTGDFKAATSLAKVYQAIAAYYPMNVYSQYNTILDVNQTLYFVAMGGTDKYDWSANMKASIKEIQASAPNFRAFLAAGEQHCILPKAYVYDVEAGGTKLAQWLADMVADKPIDNAYCPDCAP